MKTQQKPDEGMFLNQFIRKEIVGVGNYLF